MRHEHDNATRHAHNTLAEANARLDSGKVRDPREHAMLISMIKDAKEIIKNNTRPYSDTNIGYNEDTHQRRARYDNTNDAINDAMDMIDRILPHISNNMDADMRRGVPGTGRYARRRVRADRYDNDDYDNDMDDMDDYEVVNMPRWRSARTGRFLPNLYGPRRVRRVRRRAAMDDMDNRYDDINDDDMRYDRYNDTNYNEQRTNDAITRAAADAAATTARHMVANPHNKHDIYPSTPVMPRNDNMRYDARNNTHNDARNDTNYADDATSEQRPGPGMRR